MIEPTIGRIVAYRSRTGNYTLPAIITATARTLHGEGVESGDVPAITDPERVHLTVFTPGLPAKKLREFEDLSDDAHSTGIASTPSGGSYQEWNVPFSPAVTFEPAVIGVGDEVEIQQPGTWAWPR